MKPIASVRAKKLMKPTSTLRNLKIKGEIK